MRQPGGLNGFALRTESEHDCYGAGHAGTALSAALGMAVARDLAGTKENVIAFAGDAAFTNGISFEALNNIAQQTKRLIVVLNDNEWSIDRNVGAIANYLHKIVTNERYTNLHDSAARLLEKLGGKTARHMVRKAEEAAKGMLWPSMLFEEFGPHVLRSSRWPQHRPADRNISVPEDAGSSCPAARHYPEGTRLSAGARQAKEISRPWPLRPGYRRDHACRSTHLFRSLRRHPGQAGR